jgi:galactoside O-acetyltransferase
VENPFNPGYYTSPELRSLGFARVGENSVVARNCTIIGLENVVIGDNVRIDGFTSIIAPRGRVKIGSWVHIASGCSLGARAGIEIGDFSSLSQGVRLFSAIDDYSGKWMTNSVVPPHLVRVEAAPIEIGRHVPVGAGTLVLPGVVIEDGAAVGALSFVNRRLAGWFIYSGNPVRKIGPRARDLLALEVQASRRPESLLE